MDSFNEHHQAAVAHYHSIRLKYGLEAATTVTLHESREGFIRGRKANPQYLKPIENHFSYPPAQYCNLHGRANIPGFPVFYAGETPETIAEEIRLQNGDWLHLAVFYTPSPVKLEALLLLHDAYNSDSMWSQYRDEMREHIKNNPNDFGKKALAWERIQSSALQFRVEDYRDTSAISHFWLYEKAIDAIVYPSVKKDAYCNFALAPSFVDRSLELYRVYTCLWVDEKLQAHYTGRIENGRVAWNDFSQEDYDQWHSGFSSLTSPE